MDCVMMVFAYSLFAEAEWMCCLVAFLTEDESLVKGALSQIL